jgi:transcriptional regulator with XRE-family HTH domain
MQAQNRRRELGRAVRAARLRREMSQEALALESGLQRKTVHCVEAGKCDPRVSTLERIAAAVDESVVALLSGE